VKVYIVTAEANGVPKTFDGIWFFILGIFTNREDSEKYYWDAIGSGEWGEYEEEYRDYPLADSNWQVNLYSEEVHDGPVVFEKDVRE